MKSATTDGRRRTERETLDRIFNAYWREGFASSRRISYLCEGLGLVAVATFPDGSEIMASVRGPAAMGRIETRPPYYMRRGRGGSIEVIESPRQALELLSGTAGDLDRFKAETD